MSESQGANDAKELYSEIVVENLSERSKGPEGQSPERSKGPKALRAEANKVIKEVSIESFLELLPNDLIEVNELVKMYNNYFGTSKTARGFGMLNDIKGKFVKTSNIMSGKRITYYRKTRRV